MVETKADSMVLQRVACLADEKVETTVAETAVSTADETGALTGVW